MSDTEMDGGISLGDSTLAARRCVPEPVSLHTTLSTDTAPDQ